MYNQHNIDVIALIILKSTSLTHSSKLLLFRIHDSQLFYF